MKNANIRVSVVICVYNIESVIKQTLESVYRSTFSDFEVVVVDDASTDKTVSICGEFPVKLVQQKRNKGPSHSRNVGIEHSTGDIIMLLDSDVTIESDLLERMLAYLDKDENLSGVATISSERSLSPSFYSRYSALQEYLWM